MSNFLNKNNFTEKSGKSINDAVEAALTELNTTRENVDIEILEEGSKGFFGLGAKDASVRVTLKENSTPKSTVNPNRNTKTVNTVRKTEAKKADVTNKALKKVNTVSSANTSNQSPCEKAEKFLNDLFVAMKVETNVSVSLENDNMIINLSGANMGIIIGKRGDTLDSIQYLTSLVVNQATEKYIRVTIDTENYREKREEALATLANRIAGKVLRTGRKFTLEPMNPYERRIIHSNLQNHNGVTTFSVGKEPYRKVVIAPENPKPRYEKREPSRYNKANSDKKNNSDRTYSKEKTTSDNSQVQPSEKAAQKVGSYKTTYKADFKATPHKAEYKSYEEYLAAQNGEIVPPMNKTEE